MDQREPSSERIPDRVLVESIPIFDRIFPSDLASSRVPNPEQHQLNLVLFLSRLHCGRSGRTDNLGRTPLSYFSIQRRGERIRDVFGRKVDPYSILSSDTRFSTRIDRLGFIFQTTNRGFHFFVSQIDRPFRLP